MSEDAAILAVVTNPTGNWALENLPAFEDLYGAIEQLSLEAGAAGDSALATGSLETAAAAVDIARERVARAAAVVRGVLSRPTRRAPVTSRRCSSP